MKRGLVLGFFDGVHIGHQELILSAKEHADEIFVITLNESPAKFFKKEFKYILPRKKSIAKMISLGVNKVIELDFSEIANMTAKEYLEYLISNYKPSVIISGFNHSFGKNKSGNTEYLYTNANKNHYEYICIPAKKYKEEIVSSSLIRKSIEQGEIEKVNKLLGSPFTISGKVIKGAQLGRTIGFPTANIKYPKEIVQLPYGVYSSKIGNKIGILNWGLKPTVHNTKEPIVETHIIDFDRNIYNTEIEIQIINKIRNEEKFSNLEELKDQIQKDKEICLKSLL